MIWMASWIFLLCQLSSLLGILAFSMVQLWSVLERCSLTVELSHSVFCKLCFKDSLDIECGELLHIDFLSLFCPLPALVSQIYF